jgi:hypothetical protein
VFYPLLDLLVGRYGLTSTCNMSSKEALALFLWTIGTCQTTDNVADRFEHSRSTISKKFYEVLDCVDRMAGDYIRPLKCIRKCKLQDFGLISRMPLVL